MINQIFQMIHSHGVNIVEWNGQVGATARTLKCKTSQNNQEEFQSMPCIKDTVERIQTHTWLHGKKLTIIIRVFQSLILSKQNGLIRHICQLIFPKAQLDKIFCLCSHASEETSCSHKCQRVFFLFHISLSMSVFKQN